MTSPTDSKVVSRVEKLLRLAAPSSGASESERVSAALEAARIFSDNNLSVKPREEKKRATKRTDASRWDRPKRPPGYQDIDAPPPGWVRSVATRDTVCADESCGRPIGLGEPVWMRRRGFSVEYLHENWPCDDE